MKYMLLSYDDEKAWAEAGEAALGAARAEAVALTHELDTKGQYLLASPLQASSTATCVRVRDGKVLVTDGPFAETREVLGGFYLVDVPDVDVAIRIAARHPGARLGAVEIRPVVELPNLPVGSSRSRTTQFTEPSDVEIVATRTFDAPRQMIWDAHTDPRHVPNWMLGPDGWTMPVCEIDLRPGGSWHFVWRKSDGQEMSMTGDYREVAPPARLVNTERWGGEWPETVQTLELSEASGQTNLVATVRYPSRAARDAATQTGMLDGWSQSYERLDAYLRRLG